MNPVKRITRVHAGRNGAVLSGISVLVLTAGLCLLASSPVWAQVPECPDPLEILLGESCVPVGDPFEPLDLAAELDERYPGHPAITAWNLVPYWGDEELVFHLDGAVLTAEYPAGFDGCREAKVEAWTQAGCMYAKFFMRYSVAPTPLIDPILDQVTDPYDPNCDVVTLNLDDYLNVIVDPNDPNGTFPEWTYTGNSQLVVAIDPNTHQATITNPTGADVTEIITFTVCLVPGGSRRALCEPCPEHCGCASVDVTFVMTCRDVGPLVLSKDDGLEEEECVDPNGLITYQICFENPNEYPVGPLYLLDTLPANVSFVSASDGGIHDPNTGTVIWSIGLLDPNDDQVCVELVVRVSPDAERGSTLTNVALLGVVDAQDSWEVALDTDVCPPPEPQPCPECPDYIETQAVGLFCPGVATIMLTLVSVGVVAARRGRR